MATSLDSVRAFVAHDVGVEIQDVLEDSDLAVDLGVDGDDFSELIAKFQQRFSVDMSTYRWYFHHGEEGFNPGALFFRSPDAKVERISVTPRVLHRAVELGRWPLSYPPHQIGLRRPDILFNQMCVAAILLIVIASIFWKFYVS